MAVANKGKRVPEEILLAVEALLTPYNVEIRNLLAQRPQKDETDEKVKYLAVCDAEKMFSVSRFTLYRLIEAGKIQAAKLNIAKSGKVLIVLESCENYFRSKLVEN